MFVQAGLLVLGASWNSVTFDEVSHLPAGISYWQTGEFWCYHHNPPLIKQLCAVPVMLLGPNVDYRSFQYRPGNRSPDFEFAADFLDANPKNYETIFLIARLVVVIFTVWGGRIVFCWASELFGARGGLLAQALWTFCPNILAHGCLVTPDMGATVIGFYATYVFWKYLRAPSQGLALLSGILLGLAEASKFSCFVLPIAWVCLLGIRLAIYPLPVSTAGDAVRNTAARLGLDAFLLISVSLLVLNNLYAFDETGTPLCEYHFLSKTLTKDLKNPQGKTTRVNRFQGTVLGSIPMPFPGQYLLGLDDQLKDNDTVMFRNYLNGEFRVGRGWWSYYLFCLLWKTPIGTLVIAGISGILMFGRRFFLRPSSDANVKSMGWLNAFALILPLVFYLVSVSLSERLNAHLRYVLPIFPFAFVLMGGSIAFFESKVWRQLLLTLLLLINVISVGRTCPFFLSYFNEFTGGPRWGYLYLADSNADWGQGLISLRSWLAKNPQEEPVQLAYFGGLEPLRLGIPYELPGTLGEITETNKVLSYGPRPGIHIISANYLAGLTIGLSDGSRGRIYNMPQNAYTFYREFEPDAILANCLFVYKMDEDRVNRLRERASLPKWKAEEGKTTEDSGND